MIGELWRELWPIGLILLAWTVSIFIVLIVLALVAPPLNYDDIDDEVEREREEARKLGLR